MNKDEEPKYFYVKDKDGEVNRMLDTDYNRQKARQRGYEIVSKSHYDVSLRKQKLSNKNGDQLTNRVNRNKTIGNYLSLATDIASLIPHPVAMCATAGLDAIESYYKYKNQQIDKGHEKGKETDEDYSYWQYLKDNNFSDAIEIASDFLPFVSYKGVKAAVQSARAGKTGREALRAGKQAVANGFIKSTPAITSGTYFINNDIKDIKEQKYGGKLNNPYAINIKL